MQKLNVKLPDLFAKKDKNTLEFATAFQLSYEMLNSLAVSEELSNKIRDIIKDYSEIYEPIPALLEDINDGRYCCHIRKLKLLKIVSANRFKMVELVQFAENLFGKPSDEMSEFRDLLEE